jgi:hypothetical protein
LQISVLLNGATPAELAACCPFIARTYPIDYVDFHGRVGDPDTALQDVPSEWEYVVDDRRSRDPRQLEFAGVRLYYHAAHRHLRARVHHGTAGSEPPAYQPHGRLRLQLPDSSRRRANARLGSRGVRIALMPAG